MKKVLAVIGSPRKGITYKVAQNFEGKLKAIEDVNFEYLFLKEMNLETCKGCFACLKRGEEFCPNKDDRDEIIKKLEEVDGVIFVSPVYGLSVPALMKNMLDRLAFVFHRPRFFHKTFMSIIGQGVYGAKKASALLDETAEFWGFNVVKGFAMTTPEKPTDKEKMKIDKELEKAAERFYRQLNGNSSPCPSLKYLFLYRMMRSTKELTKEDFKRDFEYFEQNGWLDKKNGYYYPVKLSVFKRFIGWFGDKMGSSLIKKAKLNV